MIPFGPYRPDTPATRSENNTHVRNVLPATGFYKPMPKLSVYSGAMGSPCQGLESLTDDDGNVYVVGGDSSKLYTLSSGGTAWTERGTGYSTPADGQWKFVKYGAYVVATNFTDVMQQYELGAAGNFTTLVAEPRCRFMAVIKNFLFTGNTWDSTDGYLPYRVRWSALGDHTDFTYSKATQADFQDLSGDGGWVQGVVGGLLGADGAVFMDRAIVRLTYVSGNTIFQFDHVEGGVGTQAPNSIVKAQGVVFFLGQDGFYMFDGISLVPIGKDKVDTTFFDDVDTSALHRIWGAVDPTNTIVFWSYPSTSAGSTYNDKILAFDYIAREWSLIEINTEAIASSMTIGTNLDDLDALYPNLDTIPFSLDSRVWVGGNLKFAAVNSDHKLGYFDGDNMAAELETIETQVGQGRSMITKVWPIVDAETVYCRMGKRTYAGQQSVSYTATVTQNAIGFCPSRTEGRFHRARIIIPEATTWGKAQGVDFEFTTTGWR